MTASASPEMTQPSPLLDRLQQSSDSDAAEMFVTATAPFVITHVSPAWSRLCGWRHNQAVGKNLGVLDGKLTCESTLARMHEALAQGAATSACLVSYTKDGVPFTNSITLEPLSLHAEDGVTTHFVGTLRASPAPQGAKCAERAGAPPYLSRLPRKRKLDDDACRSADAGRSAAEHDDACRSAAEQMMVLTRRASGWSVSLEHLLEAIMPLLPLEKATALRMLVDAVLGKEMQLTQRAFQMTVQIILEEDVSILHCTAQWMALLAPNLVHPCLAAPAA